MWLETELLQACAEKDSKQVRRMLDLNANPDTYSLLPALTADALKWPRQVPTYPIELAAMLNATEVFAELSKCATLDYKQTDRYGQSALITACKRDNIEVARQLIDKCCALVNMASNSYNTPLLTSVHYSARKCTQMLLSCKRINVNFPSVHEWSKMNYETSPLIRAVQLEDACAVNMLLQNKNIAVNPSAFMLASDGDMVTIILALLLRECKLLSFCKAWCKYIAMTCNTTIAAVLRIFSAPSESARALEALQNKYVNAENLSTLMSANIFNMNSLTAADATTFLTWQKTHTAEVCCNKKKIAHAMIYGYAPVRHVLYAHNSNFQDAAFCLMLVHNTAAQRCRHLPGMPHELWVHILCFTQRRWKLKAPIHF